MHVNMTSLIRLRFSFQLVKPFLYVRHFITHVPENIHNQSIMKGGVAFLSG